MTTLLVGFDSAWTGHNSGGIVAALRLEDGHLIDLGNPQIVNFIEAEEAILQWEAQHKPTATIILLDQPTIVENLEGQRPVENVVGSPVGLRYGGMQPANRNKSSMFGTGAPVRRFLSQFGGPANPLYSAPEAKVYETFPVLAMIALGWVLPDSRISGRLPRYNPRKKTETFRRDWEFVCRQTSGAFREFGLPGVVTWLDEIAVKPIPRKADQDCLDACVCLLVAVYMAAQKDCLMIGDVETGYIVVPDSEALRAELHVRCESTKKIPANCIRIFRQAQRLAAPVGAES